MKALEDGGVTTELELALDDPLILLIKFDYVLTLTLINQTNLTWVT